MWTAALVPLGHQGFSYLHRISVAAVGLGELRISLGFHKILAGGRVVRADSVLTDVSIYYRISGAAECKNETARSKESDC